MINEKNENVIVYDVFVIFSDDEVVARHVAATKSKEKAQALVKAIEDCGSKAEMIRRRASASLEWVQKLTD